MTLKIAAIWSSRRVLLAAFSILAFTGLSPQLSAQTTSLIDVNGSGGSPASPDANSNFWSAITAINSGVVLVDSTTGLATGGSVIVTQSAGAGSGLSGSPIEGGPAPGAFNIAEAYQDAWFDNTINGGNGTFSYSGLNSTSTYQLTLWGNRDSGWADGNIAVTSGTVGGGQNFVLQQDSLLTLTAAPNGAGNLAFSIDDTGGPGSNVVLNVMSLSELGPLSVSATPSISVNFGINLNDANAVNVGETAVSGNPHAQTVDGASWNNVLLQSTAAPGVPTTLAANTQGGESLRLLDDSGNNAASLTTAGPFFSGFGNTSSPSQALTGDAGLFQSYLNIGGTVAGESITVSDLGSEFTDFGYDVLVFFDLDQNRTYGIMVDDGNTSQAFWTDDVLAPDADADNDGSIEWVQAIGTASTDATQGANYALFEDFNNSSFTITGLSEQARATISGFQVIANAAAVPEPASIAIWSLLGMVGVAFMAWRRRRHRCL